MAKMPEKRWMLPVKEIERIENLVSTGKKTSEIARIDQDGSGKVSEEYDDKKPILRSRELYEDTDGADCDISLCIR